MLSTEIYQVDRDILFDYTNLRELAFVAKALANFRREEPLHETGRSENAGNNFEEPAATCTPRIPKPLPHIHTRERQLKHETLFLAPEADMDDESLVAYFMPAQIDDRNSFIRGLVAEVQADLGAKKLSDADLEGKLKDQTARCMVLLTRALNYYRLAGEVDQELFTHISFTQGLFVDKFVPYIYSLAEPMTSSANAHDINDLIVEGQLGVLHALARFDLGREEAHFMNFARLRIHGAIIDAIRKSGSIIRQNRTHLGRRKAYDEQLSEGKSVEEIAESLHISVNKLRKALAATSSQLVLRLEYGESEDEPNLSDTIADPTQDTEAMVLGTDEPTFNLEALLGKLRTTPATVLRMRFGLAPYDHPHKLHEIGEVLGFTASRASQITIDGLRQLHSMLPEETKAIRRHF